MKWGSFEMNYRSKEKENAALLFGAAEETGHFAWEICMGLEYVFFRLEIDF